MTHDPSITEPAFDALESRLASLTRRHGDEPALWRAALETERPAATSSRPSSLREFFARPRRFSLAAGIVLFAALGVIVLTMSGNVRSGSVESVAGYKKKARVSEQQAVPPAASYPADRGPSEDLIAELKDRVDPDGTGAIAMIGKSESAQAPSASVLSERHVVRKASIDLSTPDVRATFAKLTLIPFDALGEFVETSSLTGEGRSAGATITLRVAATRLSEVLNQVRTLGTVTAENAGGQDVTDRVVDLEAHLRNEQRVEAELLALLSSRKDAPLKEILDLRESISRVRESIEQMTARREQLSRLVSLATVLVVVRPTDAPAPVITSGFSDYFLSRIGSAWQGGLRTLADVCAWLIRVVVGGLVWWLALGATVWVIFAFRAKAERASAAEPVPTR